MEITAANDNERGDSPQAFLAGFLEPQAEILVRSGYPDVLGLDAPEFRARYIYPLTEAFIAFSEKTLHYLPYWSAVPLLLIVPTSLVAHDAQVERIMLGKKRGWTEVCERDWVNLSEEPDTPYLLWGISFNPAPENENLFTVGEGIAFARYNPEFAGRYIDCFGSRARTGYRDRIPYLWKNPDTGRVRLDIGVPSTTKNAIVPHYVCRITA